MMPSASTSPGTASAKAHQDSTEPHTRPTGYPVKSQADVAIGNAPTPADLPCWSRLWGLKSAVCRDAPPGLLTPFTCLLVGLPAVTTPHRITWVSSTISVALQKLYESRPRGKL